MNWRAALFLPGLVLFAGAWTARAGAQERSAADESDARVLVQAPGCESAPHDVPALLRLLGLELAQLGLQAEALPDSEPAAADAMRSAVALVAIRCGQEAGTLVLRVNDLASGVQLERALSVAELDIEARPRALALSAATLLETSLGALAGSPGSEDPARSLPPAVRAALRERTLVRLGAQAPAAAEPVPSADTANEPAGAAPASGTRFETSVALRAFPGRSTGLIGLQLGVLPALGGSIRLAVNAEGLYGKSDLADAEGKVGVSHLLWLTGGLGLLFVVPGTPALELGPAVLAGYALAIVDVQRDGASGSDESGFVLSALASATARWAIGGGTDALLGLDLGYTPAGVVFLGDQARLSGMADVTLGLRVGVGWN